MHCQSLASHRRDEILGTTLKDFRQFAEVLAAVRDKGQVVAVTSGEQHWGQRGMWEAAGGGLAPHARACSGNAMMCALCAEPFSRRSASAPTRLSRS